jgi:type II secretory pathway component GspD/PulD (secretin)
MSENAIYDTTWVNSGLFWLAALTSSPAWTARRYRYGDAQLRQCRHRRRGEGGGQITGKNFLLDPRVKGTVNIVSAKPMSRALVYEVFLSALRLHGYAAVEDRGIVKLVPEGDAKLYPGVSPAAKDKPHATGDRIQTQVYTLKYESAVQLVPILRPLISANNSISANPGSNCWW